MLLVAIALFIPIGMVLFVVYGFPLLIRLLTEKRTNSDQTPFIVSKSSAAVAEPSEFLFLLYCLIFLLLIGVGCLIFFVAFVLGLYGGIFGIMGVAITLLVPYIIASYFLLRHIKRRWLGEE